MCFFPCCLQGVYAHIFEQPFLETTNQFYQVEGMRLMGELDVPAYLAHCEVRDSSDLLQQNCQKFAAHNFGVHPVK